MTFIARGRSLLLSAVVAGLVAACSATATPSASPAASPAASPGGPTSFADWTARQGFGGASGIGVIDENVRRVLANPSVMTDALVDQDLADITGLAGWLDEHPATPCWADYHATVRAGLDELTAAYAKLRAAIDATQALPKDVTTSMAARTTALLAMEAPAGCP